MDEEKPPEKPPTPRKVKGTRGLHLTAEQYEVLAASYLASTSRSARALARETGVSLDTAIRAINLGWPHKQWAPLKERAKLYDAQKNRTTDQPPLTAAEIADVRRFIETQGQNLDMMRSFKAIAARLGNRINEAINVSTAERYGKRSRVVQVRQGKKTVERLVTEDVALPPYLPALASALRDLGSLAFGAGDQERKWFKADPPEGEAPIATRWKSMTDEQLDYVAKTGRLPPGFASSGT